MQKPAKNRPQAAVSPAPGSYNIERSTGLTKVTQKSAVFSKSSRNFEPNQESSMGPGAYSLQ